MYDSPWRRCFWGTDTPMCTSQGCVPRVFLNNAATPQVAKPVTEIFRQMLSYYAYDNEPNFISRKMREAYNNVRNIVLDYVDGDPALDTVIYAPTTTVAINMLSYMFWQLDSCQTVITTRMEHMANYLPFKEKFETVLVRGTPDGAVDMEDYHRLLRKYRGKVKLVTVTGASNITGIIPPYYQMASLAHEYGAKIFLDAVQLVQHKPFSMKPHTDPEHIDFLSFDGHKCYTGQSGGVLIGPKEFFDARSPMVYGAGIADFISDEKCILREAPERHEAGYPDFMGIIAIGEALRFLQWIGLRRIAGYEEWLYQYLLKQLREIPGLTLYGSGGGRERLPFVAFNLDGVSYQQLGDKLGFEYGIAVAAGTSGANIYVQDLLGLTNEEAYRRFRSGQNYGLVRVTPAFFNSSGDMDRLVDALYKISCGRGISRN